SDAVARVRLFGAALESMELFHDDRLALMTLSQELFTRTGATRADTEDIVNAALRVASVEVAVLITESTDGVVKLSFRSKGHVDVAELAGRFGGGGHTRAAGARVKMPLARIKREVIETTIALGL
ncbi:MAG: bifunctional oligoribonuclease/PAP phosphatase NrnA, partial [Planctomycetes bacterium]|nr:bifunctional oligoribonuclease/PAP phosphatase NrnA [Planctomycetota bacterium]